MRLAELAAEIRDVAVDDVRRRGRLASPYPLERQLATDHLPRVAEQQLEQVGFARPQRDRDGAASRRPTCEIEDEIRERKRLGRLLPTARQRTCARKQLLGGKRLDEVVVGSAVQPAHAIVDSIFGGENQDGRLKTALAPLESLSNKRAPFSAFAKCHNEHTVDVWQTRQLLK